MKKIIAVLLVVLSLFAFTACGEKTIDFTGLGDELSELKTEKGDDNVFAMLMGVDEEFALSSFNLEKADVDEIFYMSPSIINVDCVLVVKPAKDKAEKVQGKIDEYIKAQEELASWYVPANAEYLKNRLETEWGGYKILIVSTSGQNEAALNLIKSHA